MKITITRALAELKLYDSRITKKLNESQFADCKTGRVKTTMFKGLDPQVFTETAKADYDSIVQLIENRRKMKSAIMASNAMTKVSIAGESYTVSEAIEKKTSIEYLKKLLLQMRQQIGQMTAHAAKNNASIEQQVITMVQKNVEGTDKKLTEQDYEIIGKPMREANEVIVLDPLKLPEKISGLEKQIEEFEKEVDFTLSESNSRTEIEV